MVPRDRERAAARTAVVVVVVVECCRRLATRGAAAARGTRELRWVGTLDVERLTGRLATLAVVGTARWLLRVNANDAADAGGVTARALRIWALVRLRSIDDAEGKALSVAVARLRVAAWAERDEDVASRLAHLERGAR